MKAEKEQLKREKVKAIITGQTGNEPVYKKIPGTCSNIDLVNGLNYYSKFKSTKESYQYLQSYFKKHNKDLLHKLNQIKPDIITNKGFIVRMIENGFNFNPSNEVVIENIIKFVKDYKIEDSVNSSTIVPVIKQKVVNENEVLINYLDEMIDGYTAPIKLDVDKPQDIKFAKKYIDNIISDINEIHVSPETGKVEQHYLPKTVNRIKAISSYIETLLKATKKTAIRKKAVKKIDPAKAVAKLKYLQKNELFNSIKPTEIIGKKKLFLFDTKYRKLRLLISNNELGFLVKGTTIENVDMEKSQEVSVKEKDVPALASNKNISGINNFFKNISKKQKPLANTRVNEFNIILIAS